MPLSSDTKAKHLFEDASIRTAAPGHERHPPSVRILRLPPGTDLLWDATVEAAAELLEAAAFGL